MEAFNCCINWGPCHPPLASWWLGCAGWRLSAPGDATMSSFSSNDHWPFYSSSQPPKNDNGPSLCRLEVALPPASSPPQLSWERLGNCQGMSGIFTLSEFFRCFHKCRLIFHTTFFSELCPGVQTYHTKAHIPVTVCTKIRVFWCTVPQWIVDFLLDSG